MSAPDDGLPVAAAPLNAPAGGDGTDLCSRIMETLTRMNERAAAELKELESMLRELGVDPDEIKAQPSRRSARAAAPTASESAPDVTSAPPSKGRRRSAAPVTPDAPKRDRVPQDVLEVLSCAVVDGLSVRLPPAQLERKLYEAVDEVLRACGGARNRKAKSHLFAVDPAALLGDVVNTGTIARAPDLGWFPTPPAVVAELLARADVRPGMTVREPSAGEGAIALPLRAAGALVTCIELDPLRAATLRALGFDVVEGDALALDSAERVDRVVMNPPFARQADLDHVRHAHGWLAPGGRLVSVMGAGTAFRQDARATDFRAWVASLGGVVEALPDGSFLASGTGVRTVVVTVPASLGAAARPPVAPPVAPTPVAAPRAQLSLFDAVPR